MNIGAHLSIYKLKNFCWIMHSDTLIKCIYIGEENFRSRKATEKLGAVMHKKNSNGKLIYLLFKQDYVL